MVVIISNIINYRAKEEMVSIVDSFNQKIEPTEIALYFTTGEVFLILIGISTFYVASLTICYRYAEHNVLKEQNAIKDKSNIGGQKK